MPSKPLALDIYVKSPKLKRSKHRVGASTNPNEPAVLSEAKLASCRDNCRRSGGSRDFGGCKTCGTAADEPEGAGVSPAMV
jgi:hypothetical protein